MPIKSFFNLFFPDLCQACGENLMKQEKIICLSCLSKIAYTDFHLHEENPISRLFFGRCNIEQATAMCFYERENRIQNLIHKLKYKGKKEVGLFLGAELAKVLITSQLYKDIDAIVPIPLHKKKEHIRGYNQSMIIALGMLEFMDIPIIADSLIRLEFTETQTKKNRWDRYENVKNMFAVQKEDQIKGKHLLLIDDVITTGATIEACVKHLSNIEGVKISVAGLASSAL